MGRNPALVTAAVLVLSLVGAAPGAGELRVFEIDATRSTLEVDVARGGLLKAFGHDHLIVAKGFSGRIQLDPERPESSSVTLHVVAPSLRVADREISDEDRAKVQSTMLGEKVLGAARFPEIAFASTRARWGGSGGETRNLSVVGTLGLHGVEKEVTIPVTLKIAGADLEATGEVSILQTDYGITPVRAGRGLVKVRDRVRIRFVIHARDILP
jgi:polyisoprenoid-binding protein YceI